MARTLGQLGMAAAGLALAAVGASANITFTQTVDGWWHNEYEWAAQTEAIQTPRGGDAIGTVKNVWIRVVQKNGSRVGTEVFCTTMKKTFAGAFGDRWDVDVPAGRIVDSDFWDATQIGIELVECSGATRRCYNTLPNAFGSLQATDYLAADIEDAPNNRRVSIDASQWHPGLVMGAGFDFAVYAYQTGPGLPTILNHVDEVGLTTFAYEFGNAFGSGAPFDPNRLLILGINLDPSWNAMPAISTGLNFFQWNLFAGGGNLVTDQGVFNILNWAPLVGGWNVFCTTDVNRDNNRDFFDLLLFLNGLANGEPAADWNADGLFDFFDIVAFLNDFAQPCP